MMNEIILSIKKIQNKMGRAFKKIIKIIKQSLCRHKRTEFTRKVTTDGLTLHCINGERIYEVCEDCGKIIGSYFLEYEGMGYK
ncbi:MAG: hypothetical protein Q4P25_06025 [Tissierellia bacterium]|nr:hypothetical protein [Tissierellia bacterium]